MKSKQFYSSTAWRWFSRYVLLHYSNEGVVQCATSGVFMQVNDRNCHLGHLIKVFETGGKTNFNTAFDERNVMPQSHQENVYKSGNEIKMMEAINKRFGEDTYNQLKIKARTPYKLDPVEMKDISDYYRLKFNELAKTKGNPWK